MNEFIKYVGLDVHKETIAVSVADSTGGEARYVGALPTTQEAIKKLVKQLKKDGAKLSFCYEAGPLRVWDISTAAGTGAGVPGNRAVADPEEAGGSGKDRPAGQPVPGPAAPVGGIDGR